GRLVFSRHRAVSPQTCDYREKPLPPTPSPKRRGGAEVVAPSPLRGGDWGRGDCSLIGVWARCRDIQGESWVEGKYSGGGVFGIGRKSGQRSIRLYPQTAEVKRPTFPRRFHAPGALGPAAGQPRIRPLSPEA